MRQIQLVRCDSSPHRWETACPPGLRRAGEGPACGSLALPTSRLRPAADHEPRLNNYGVAADNGGMTATIDDRLLEQWKVSRRHQDEARRFLARQKFSDPRGERRALEEIVGTIADLEQTLRERAARRSTRPTQTGPHSA